MSNVLSPTVRKVAYFGAVGVFAALTAWGVLNQGQVDWLLPIISSILGAGTAGLAASHVNTSDSQKDSPILDEIHTIVTRAASASHAAAQIATDVRRDVHDVKEALAKPAPATVSPVLADAARLVTDAAPAVGSVVDAAVPSAAPIVGSVEKAVESAVPAVESVEAALKRLTL